jgi:predicted enzyme related to lactoylglutathione lyase
VGAAFGAAGDFFRLMSIPATAARRCGTSVPAGRRRDLEVTMPSPIVHAEIRSADPDATRAFFGDLFGWTFPDGAFPGYSYVESGVPDALPAGIGPVQGGSPLVTFFVGVEDIDAAVASAKKLGGTLVQEPTRVPGVAFALIADPAGQVVGLAQQL